MFNNWNIVKHASMSVIVSLCIGLISYFIIKPTNSSSSIGIVEGEGQLQYILALDLIQLLV
jgi:hypothetical protein